MGFKNYVKDENCKVFDTQVKIKQCKEYLEECLDNRVAYQFDEVKNAYGGKDLYISVKTEDGMVYVVSMGYNNRIIKIRRF